MEEKKILDILARSYHKNFTALKFLRKGGCVSYCVWGEHETYFMKIIPSAFMNTAKQSLDILMYLQDKSFPSPHIILSKNGLPYVEVDELDDKNLWVLFEYIDGSEPCEEEDFEAIGQLVGQLHSHGDLHLGNLLRTSSGKYYLLDFDTSCYAFPTYDIMIICNSTNYFDFDENGYQKSKVTYEAFLKGYTKHCTLSDIELEAFYDFIAIYHYQLQATIIEIYGLDCVDDEFLDKQLDWLMKWRELCERQRLQYRIFPSANG